MKIERVLRLTLSLVFSASVLLSASSASAAKRLGVIDIKAETLTARDKINALNQIKKSLARQRILTLLRDQEVQTYLIKKNPLREQTSRLERKHANDKKDIEDQIQSGKKYYLASQFEEASGVLKSALLALPTASLAMNVDIPEAIVENLAVSEYFQGHDDRAKEYITAHLNLNPFATIDPHKYPIRFVELFSSVKEKKRRLWREWTFKSSHADFRAQFLGLDLDVEKGDLYVLKLPLSDPIWKKQSLVLRKQGYAPLILPLEALPKVISFKSLKDTRRSTKGLFAPIGALTPPVELKRFVVKLGLDVVFLGSVARDRSDRWVLKGQWLEGSTNRTSPVVEASHTSLVQAVNKMTSELLTYLSPEGNVRIERMIKLSRPELPVVKESKPFYKTWWFWTLVGVGVTGAGVGGYFLLKPEDELKFSVQKQ